MNIRGFENLSDQVSSSGSEDFKCRRYRANIQCDMQLRRMETKLATLLSIFILWLPKCLRHGSLSVFQQ